MEIVRLINNSATITLTYDEIRDISNGLYYLTNPSLIENNTNEEYKNVAAKTSFLFDMVKHGNIQPETVNKLFEVYNKDVKKGNKV